LAGASTKIVVEHCWTLVGLRRGPFWYARRVRKVTGKPASVEFDASWVLRREEDRGDVVGFYHTHPGGPPQPSKRDLRTMHAWVAAFGKPLLCLIESEGMVAAFRFDDDESDAIGLVCECFPRGVVIVLDPITSIDAEVPS